MVRLSEAKLVSAVPLSTPTRVDADADADAMDSGRLDGKPPTIQQQDSWL
jgi:hypothetical protein